MFDDLTLPELFTAADAIGNRYQSRQERLDYIDQMLDAVSGVEGYEADVVRLKAEQAALTVVSLLEEAIAEADAAIQVAETAKANLNASKERITAIAASTLERHPLL